MRALQKFLPIRDHRHKNDDVYSPSEDVDLDLHLRPLPPSKKMFGFLPFLTVHRDAASFHHSILPFYSSSINHIFEYRHAGEIYKTTNPFVFGSFFSVATSLLVFMISSMTGNWSWYFPSLLGKGLTEGWIDSGVFCLCFMGYIILHSPE